MCVVQPHAAVKVHESERDLHNLHTFEHRLSRLYTWRQRAKKGKSQKNTVQMRHSCTLSGRKQPQALIRQHLFPLSIKDGEGARG